MGRDDEAVGCFEEASRRFRALGRTMGVHLATSGLGRAAAWRGETERALELLSSARDGFASFGQDAWRVDAELRILEAAVLAGDPPPLERFDALLAAAEGLDDPGIMTVWGARLRAAAQVRRGDAASAALAFREAADRARAFGQAVERKGLPLLLRSFEALREHIPCELTVIGPSREELAPLMLDDRDVRVLQDPARLLVVMQEGRIAVDRRPPPAH